MAHFNEYLDLLELSPLVYHFLHNGKTIKILIITEKSSFIKKESSFVGQMKCAIILPMYPKEVSAISVSTKKEISTSPDTVSKRIL